MELHHLAGTLIITLTLFLLPSTAILEKYPEFSTFNNYLTATLLEKQSPSAPSTTPPWTASAPRAPPLAPSRTSSPSTSSSTTSTPRSSALSPTPPSLSDLNGGNIGFSPNHDAPVAATFVKAVEAVPHNLFVIQISAALVISPEAAAPDPAPIQVNLTAALLLSSAAAEETFEANIETGLTTLYPLLNCNHIE